MPVLKVPESIEEEHNEIFSELESLAKMHNRTGEAVARLLSVLRLHFEKENELAMPLLGALSSVTSSKPSAELQEVVALYKKLKKELPIMLNEHKEIGELVSLARHAAQKERKRGALQMLEVLEHHAKMEEEVFYPAALAAGMAADALRKSSKA